MSKTKRSNFKPKGGKIPSPPGKVVDPSKRIKITPEELKKSQQFQMQISGLQASIGRLRMDFLFSEQRLLDRNKITLEEAEKFDTMIKKKYSIIGNIVGFDSKLNELILE